MSPVRCANSGDASAQRSSAIERRNEQKCESESHGISMRRVTATIDRRFGDPYAQCGVVELHWLQGRCYGNRSSSVLSLYRA